MGDKRDSNIKENVMRKKVLAVFAAVVLLIVTVGSLAATKVPRYTQTAKNLYPVDWYLDSNLQNGLWYEDVNAPIVVGGYEVSFMKIYSLGGDLRVMELSTYPRAYKDTSAHVYTVDTPFTVSLNDLNSYYYASQAQEGKYQPRVGIADGTHIYVDSHRIVFLQGEIAIHYAGDPLPGAFPLWLESETLPTPSWVDNKTTVFPAVFQAIKGQLATYILHEAVYRGDTDITWTPMPSNYFNQLNTALSGTDTQMKINAKIGKDRLIIRVIYDRTINPK